MDTARTPSMRENLEYWASNLQKMHGRLMARNFTLNPSAGTISDIRDGSLWALITQDWVDMTQEYIRARMIRLGTPTGHTVSC